MAISSQKESDNSLSDDEDIDNEIRKINEINTSEEKNEDDEKQGKDEKDKGPEFLRPLSAISNRCIGNTSTLNATSNGNVGDAFGGRITPPPCLISPLPTTPAGSMTPVS